MISYFRFILVLLLLLFTAVLPAQMSDSLANYYYYVNQAELLISDNNLLGAERKYEKAAEFKSNWFGRDEYNLALLKLKLDRPKEMMPIVESLAKKGFDLKLLIQKESFKEYFATKKGSKELKSLETAEPSYNVELRATYDSLYAVDSIANEEYSSKNFNLSVAKTDSSNIELLKKLLNQYGFPSEDLIGIHGWFSSKPIVALISHHSRHQQIGLVVDFNEFIQESGEAGFVNRFTFSALVTASSLFNQYNSGDEISQWKIKDSLYSTPEQTVYADSVFSYSLFGNLERGNDNRRSVGLPSVEESVKLSKFNWENRHDFILGTARKNTYVIDNEKAFRMIKSNSIPIEITPFSED